MRKEEREYIQRRSQNLCFKLSQFLCHPMIFNLKESDESKLEQ